MDTNARKSPGTCRKRSGLLVALLWILAAGCAPAVGQGPVARSEIFEIYAPAARRYLSLPQLVDALREFDVVLFGEQHDDEATHVAERRLLEELADRGAEVVVAMEMLERDVQPVVDEYLAGRVPEAEFLKAARAWPIFPEAYAPLVEVARRNGWEVVASNVPRAIASATAEHGLEALSGLDPVQRSYAAAEVLCPRDEYFRRFAEVMGMHPGGSTTVAREGGSAVGRMYEAQCLRDETMAESILRARDTGAMVVHFNGGFHSDRRLGIVPRLLRRDPDLRVAVITAVPVADPTNVEPERFRGLADYVVLTRRPTEP